MEVFSLHSLGTLPKHLHKPLSDTPSLGLTFPASQEETENDWFSSSNLSSPRGMVWGTCQITLKLICKKKIYKTSSFLKDGRMYS